jgi:tetratricopeptide (TPR) repeat protein
MCSRRVFPFLVLAVAWPVQAAPPVVRWSQDAAPWAPAFLQVVDRKHPVVRKVRVRVYADAEYRANVPRWQDRARALFDDLNVLAAQSSNPTLTTTQVKSWNAVLTRLDEVGDAQAEGGPARAMKVVGQAVQQAETLPPQGGPPVWLAIARRYQSLGALTRADEALVRAGTEPGTVRVRAELQRARRLYGLPCKSVGPGSEPEYVQAFDGLMKTPAKSREGAIARALATYPEAPGLLMLECEAHLRARRARPAERACQAAIAGAPELARAHYLLGQLATQGKAGDAATHLRRALELDPLAYETWTGLSALYRSTGKAQELEELRADYQKRFQRKLP